jgi:hypothetical protein
MQELYNTLREQMFNLQKDVISAEKGNKTAARRVRRDSRTIGKGLKQLSQMSSSVKGEETAVAPVAAPVLSLTPAA